VDFFKFSEGLLSASRSKVDQDASLHLLGAAHADREDAGRAPSLVAREAQQRRGRDADHSLLCCKLDCASSNAIG
jgi:hypothetical protein